MARDGSLIQCPICLHELDWPAADLVVVDGDGNAVPWTAGPGKSVEGERLERMGRHRMCQGSGAPHMLPDDFGLYEHRVTIGLVGDTGAGKTHLLAAMIGHLERGIRLSEIGLSVQGLDRALHAAFMRDRVVPFLDRHQQLKGTDRGVAFADALLVTNHRTGLRIPVTFFDVAGEQLRDTDPASVPFLGAVNALIFVVDPAHIRGTGIRGARRSEGDAAFDNALHVVRQAHGATGEPFLDIPSATVVAKSDLLRGDATVDRWLTLSGHEEEHNLATVEQESADVYAYLYTHSAERWLEPAAQCADSTLHFTSAAGFAPVGDTFPRPPRPRRVLKPLLSLLAMRGVLDPALLDRQDGPR
jgi:hypothetical protein